MTLKEANNFFESLKTETTKKSEIKVYEKFLHILTGLKTRTFSEDEHQSIETELDRLNLKSNPTNRKKYFKKALSKFEKHLKDSFSLTSKRYYTQSGITLGASFGILFGVLFLSRWERSMGISLGLIIGSGIGGAIGRSMDSQAKAAGKML
tara:strand:+ start:837 stop:1289 length:453 start_codon:yes stop_codon:yes gene_type:complete